jgi:hypothetical protein
MMPFAKWIPVDEEIVDGDFWIYKGYAMSPVQQKEDPFPQDSGQKVRQKVKLFLCTRDFSVGDIIMEDGNFIPFEWTRMMDSSLPFGDELFKVLGEISPKALIYVREGQEFNEGEYQLSEHPECPKCGAWSNDGFCPEEVECQIAKKRTVAYIQCSNCRQFH